MLFVACVGSRLGRGAVGAHLQGEELAAGQVTDSCSCYLGFESVVAVLKSLLCFPLPAGSETGSA